MQIQLINRRADLALILKEVKEISGTTWEGISTKFGEMVEGGSKDSAGMLRKYAASQNPVSARNLYNLILSAQIAGWAGPVTFKILARHQSCCPEGYKQAVSELREHRLHLNKLRGQDARKKKKQAEMLEKLLRKMMASQWRVQEIEDFEYGQ